ncbi:MAG: hypothetical protein ACFFD4_16620 [Candidatus Odinarchaeota archaeon]
MLNKSFIPKTPIMTSLYTQLRRSFAFTIKDIKVYYNKGPLVIQGILFPLVFFFAFTVGRQIEPAYVISGLMFLVLFLTVTSIGSVILPFTHFLDELGQAKQPMDEGYGYLLPSINGAGECFPCFYYQGMIGAKVKGGDFATFRPAFKSALVE